MKRNIFNLVIIFIFNISFGFSQTYSLIEAIFEKSDTVYLKNEFHNFNDLKLDKSKIIKAWKFQSALGGPQPDEFIKAFKFQEIESFRQQSDINFTKLTNKFIAIKNVSQIPNSNKNSTKNNMVIISNPIFNCKKDWAIIYHTILRYYDSGDENLFIYKKNKDGIWMKFYTITLKFS